MEYDLYKDFIKAFLKEQKRRTLKKIALNDIEVIIRPVQLAPRSLTGVIYSFYLLRVKNLVNWSLDKRQPTPTPLTNVKKNEPVDMITYINKDFTFSSYGIAPYKSDLLAKLISFCPQNEAFLNCRKVKMVK